MIISCSACSTRYLVDPALIGADGREVRCAKCGHQWLQMPPDEVPEPPPPLQPEIRSVPEEEASEPDAAQAKSRLPAVPQPARRRFGSALSWALLLVLVAIFVGGVAARHEIMAAWPPSARLYERLGLASPTYEGLLTVRNGSSAYQEEDGKPVLVVQGDVVNTSTAMQVVPKLRASLRENGREVQSWIFQATQSKLMPGEAASFVTRFKEPSPSATDLTITFLDEP